MALVISRLAAAADLDREVEPLRYQVDTRNDPFLHAAVLAAGLKPLMAVSSVAFATLASHFIGLTGRRNAAGLATMRCEPITISRSLLYHQIR